MSQLSRFLMAAGLAVGLGGVAQAAPPSALPAVAALSAEGASVDLLQEVRYVTRCRPVTVHRRDRYGRPVRVTRERCRRVWVGGPPPRRAYRY